MLLSEQRSLFPSDFSLRKLPKTQYMGGKQKLIQWIFDCAPKDIDIVFDAFSGTSSVGYHFKTKGKQIIANDFLKFNCHIGKAVIENKDTVLAQKDIDLLLSKNEKSGSLIEKTFSGIFFERDQARFLDNFRANINFLANEHKKSLAFTIMNRALTRKILLGHFAHLRALEYSKNPARIKRNPSITQPIKNLFLELIDEYNYAVFDNKRKNKVYCKNTVDLIKQLKNIDLVYFDPPYCGCHPDYQAFYHFLETFVEYWTDKKFINGTKQYHPKKQSGFVKKTEIIDSFKKLFKNSRHIPYWLISYNSKSYPDQETLISLMKPHRKVEIFENEYKNHYGGRGSRRGTKEYLFLCYE